MRLGPRKTRRTGSTLLQIRGRHHPIPVIRNTMRKQSCQQSGVNVTGCRPQTCGWLDESQVRGAERAQIGKDRVELGRTDSEPTGQGGRVLHAGG
jgi:hypothetical protein